MIVLERQSLLPLTFRKLIWVVPGIPLEKASQNIQTHRFGPVRRAEIPEIQPKIPGNKQTTTTKIARIKNSK